MFPGPQGGGFPNGSRYSGRFGGVTLVTSSVIGASFARAPTTGTEVLVPPDAVSPVNADALTPIVAMMIILLIRELVVCIIILS
jgi:hypothetical protein